MKALRFALDCRGPADWVELDLYDRHSDAKAQVEHYQREDVRTSSAWRWEYRIRECGGDSCLPPPTSRGSRRNALDKPVEPSQRDDL